MAPGNISPGGGRSAPEADRPRLREGIPSLSHHEYSVEYVASVQVPAVRDYLTSIGLPVDHVLFSAMEDSSGDGMELVSGRHLLVIGAGAPDTADMYGVDCVSGEVVYVSRVDTSASHVSVSPRQFDECLRVFEVEIANTGSGDDPEGLEEVSERLAERLVEIDSSIQREDPGFWGSILFDVANGDYIDDEC